MQDVEIYLNFIGKFDAPVEEREPTAEELEQQRIKQYWKDRYWKVRDKELARRKRKKQEADAQRAKNFPAEHEQRVSEILDEVRRDEQMFRETGNLNAAVVSVAGAPGHRNWQR